MKRREIGWIAAAVMLAGLVAASAPAFPNETESLPTTPARLDLTAAAEAVDSGKPTAVPEVAAEGAAEGSAEAPPAAKESTVETILRQQEELLRGQRFSYDPEGRRDPFQSLFENIRTVPAAQRPKGVTGMLVSELDLDGIVQDANGGSLAFVMGSDNKGYFLRVGDTVYDGSVIGIDPRTNTVTFRQRVDDPRVIKPYRDVVKSLAPQEEVTPNE